MPSVTEGTILMPAARSCERTESFDAAGTSSATDDVPATHWAEYQNGETSLNRSALATTEAVEEVDVQ
jgi:hypothetical protein